ncbi:uncharacterized protein LOC132733501 [Ruditapes philippinarum]|uniref:uncharacterized protein LOC132733501 n=1 Tax=Ruditapes philippinarum TaxID=129788 RepID=UPI00295BE783|nr:uncharacterized protein LOC132733501 [Ruditapes philippinarum]
MKTLIVILLLSFVCLVHCRGPRLPNMITSNLRSSKVNNKRMINETNIPPSRGPMEDDLYEIQHAFMFPGSNYLIDLLKDYVSYMMENDMDSVDMKDFFQFPECDIKDLMSEWRKVYVF